VGDHAPWTSVAVAPTAKGTVMLAEIDGGEVFAGASGATTDVAAETPVWLCPDAFTAVPGFGDLRRLARKGSSRTLARR
jgi:hypothetical protein